jgi:hypothetical protein
MRPNTPHLVYTPEAAICHGGHFYSTSTIRHTVFGIYHTFSASRLLTNTEHTKHARLLLRRIITYIHYVFVRRRFQPTEPVIPTPHVPDVSTFEGTIDLFMLCIVMELGDLLDPRAYERRKLDYKELVASIHARGLARDIVDWWQTHYEFKSTSGSVYGGREVFQRLFAHQARVLVVYKRLAEEHQIDSDEEGCTADALITRIVLHHGVQLTPDWSSRPSDWESLTFDWPDDAYSVQVRIPPPPRYEPSMFLSCLEVILHCADLEHQRQVLIF